MQLDALLPKFSALDLEEQLEGALDPLGFETISNRLALELAPALTERQKHPRFFTLYAVGLHLWDELSERETFQGVTLQKGLLPYEWLMVEAFCRLKDKGYETRGLPGQLKCFSALKDRRRLGAVTYLSVPTVFGFMGVYRYGARGLGIEQSERLGENGYGLLERWQAEQDLPGFFSGSGSGASLRQSLLDELTEAQKAGQCTSSGRWPYWETLPRCLNHLVPGSQERTLLYDFLLEDEVGHRRELLSALVKPEFYQLWRQDESERAIHEGMLSGSSAALKPLLLAILAYEEFCRTIQDAFYHVLWLLSDRTTFVSPTSLVADHVTDTAAAQKVSTLYRTALEYLSIHDEGARAFVERFQAFENLQTGAEYVETLLQRHEENQKRKPPNGKLPFITRSEKGAVVVRAPYRLKEAPQPTNRYVGLYRTASLHGFLSDLEVIPREVHTKD